MSQLQGRSSCRSAHGFFWGITQLRNKGRALIGPKSCHLASSTGCLHGLIPVQWWVWRTRVSGWSWSRPARESRVRPFYDLNGEEAKCEGTGCRKSWWCFTKDRGSWTLQRLLLTFSSTNMSWRVTGRCPQLKSASGASSTCTMSWGTSTHTVSPAINYGSFNWCIHAYKLYSGLNKKMPLHLFLLYLNHHWNIFLHLYTQSKFLSPWIALTRKLNRSRMSTLTYGQIQTHLTRMGNEDMGY